MFKTKRGSINIENVIEYLINNVNIESNGNFGKNVDHSLLIWGFLFKRQKYDYIYHSNWILSTIEFIEIEKPLSYHKGDITVI